MLQKPLVIEWQKAEIHCSSGSRISYGGCGLPPPHSQVAVDKRDCSHHKQKNHTDCICLPVYVIHCVSQWIVLLFIPSAWRLYDTTRHLSVCPVCTCSVSNFKARLTILGAPYQRKAGALFSYAYPGFSLSGCGAPPMV